MIHESHIKLFRFVETYSRIDRDTTKESRIKIEYSDFLKSAPQPPTNLSITEVGATTISLDWDASPSSGVDDYTVYVYNNTQDELEQTITEIELTEAEVMGLTTDEEYEFWVVSVRDEIESAESNHVIDTPTQPDSPIVSFRDLDAAQDQYFTLAHNSTLLDIRSIFMLVKYDINNSGDDEDPLIHKDAAGLSEGDFVYGKGGPDAKDYIRTFIQGSPQLVLGNTAQVAPQVGELYSIILNLTNTRGQLIVNNFLEEEVSPGNDMSDNTNPFRIGERNGFNWDGKIYYLGFFDSELNSDDWQELYNLGIGKEYDDLSTPLKNKVISYYNMSAESGDEPDQHGSNDLVDNNGIGSGADEINEVVFYDLYIQTDTHLRDGVDGDPGADYAGSEAGRAYYASHSRVRNFVDIVNTDLPDAVFHLGDIVDAAESGSTSDVSFFNTIWDTIDESVLKKITMGNHDFDEFTYEQLTTQFGYDGEDEVAGSKFNSTFTLNKNGVEIRVIFVDTNFDGSGNHANTVEGHLPQAALDWIEGILNTMEERLCIICSHHLPHAYNVGSGHFDQTDAEALRDIVTGAVSSNANLDNVISLGGHSHGADITEYTNLSSFKGFGLPDSIEGRGEDSVTNGCITITLNLTTGGYDLALKQLSYPYPDE